MSKSHNRKDNDESADLVIAEASGEIEGSLKAHCGKVPLMPMTETIRITEAYGHQINEISRELIVQHGGVIDRDNPPSFVIRKGVKFELLDEKEGRVVSETKSGVSIVGIKNTDAIRGYNGANLKITSKILSELSRQAIVDGERIPDKGEIYISMPELVRLRLANSERSARRMFRACANMLDNIRISGVYVTKTGEELASQEKMRRPFDGYDMGKRVAKLLLNLHGGVDWGLLTEKEMVIPDFHLRVSSKASQLCHMIFAYARRNIRKFKGAEDHLKIPMEKIRIELALPKPSETDTPNRHIRDVIERAIQEIKREYDEDFEDEELELRVMHETNADLRKINIREFLRFCFLRVKVKGRLREDIRKVAGARRRKKPKPEIPITATVSDSTPYSALPNQSKESR